MRLTMYDLKDYLHDPAPRVPPLRAEESRKCDELYSSSHQTLGALQMLLEEAAGLLSPEPQPQWQRAAVPRGRQAQTLLQPTPARELH